MQAIVTKFICPTNTKGSRYKATCEAMSVMIHADDALNPDANHKAACDELCKRMDAKNVAKYGTGAAQWTKPKIQAQLPSGEHVFVFAVVDRELECGFAKLVARAGLRHPHFEQQDAGKPILDLCKALMADRGIQPINPQDA